MEMTAFALIRCKYVCLSIYHPNQARMRLESSSRIEDGLSNECLRHGPSSWSVVNLKSCIRTHMRLTPAQSEKLLTCLARFVLIVKASALLLLLLLPPPFLGTQYLFFSWHAWCSSFFFAILTHALGTTSSIQFGKGDFHFTSLARRRDGRSRRQLQRLLHRHHRR